ncbi:hypothetical protein [Flavobacterium caeni]|uniref:hypothetical protein n=1 Tax=Flavobacterium caeni TaxID=490189 RepID=UPI000B86CB2D|nr:hypothetical protein [Flavobacterium caeni]
MKNVFTKLKIGDTEIKQIREAVEQIEKENYAFKNWFPRPGLKEKNEEVASRIYVGQTYDKNQFDIVKDGWTHDHCEICFKTLDDDDGGENSETSGYFDGSDWICKSCFEELVLSEDLEKTLAILKNTKK